MNNFFSRLAPFLMLGVLIVVFIAGIVIFSYLLILGALVGLVLFALTWLREKMFPSKQLVKKNKHRRGDVIDHE